MSSTPNPYESPVIDSTNSQKTCVELSKKFAIISLLSTLTPFVVGGIIERTFGLMSGSQLLVLFTASIVITLKFGCLAFASWIRKLIWCIMLLVAYVVVTVIYAVGGILLFGMEGT